MQQSAGAAAQLADGVTRVQVALTAQSADRLQLESGKAVLVLIKAPWVDVNSQRIEADNQLSGTVREIEQGERRTAKSCSP